MEIKTGKEWFYGYVVYVGIELSKNEVYAKIVDSGKKIASVEFLLDSLDDYLKQLNECKIGEIVRIKSTNNGFKLTKCKKPKINMKKLP